MLFLLRNGIFYALDFGIFEIKSEIMKQLVLLFLSFIILSIGSFASNTPEQVLAKLQINQLPFSKLQPKYIINDSLKKNLDSYSYYEEEYFDARKRRNGGIFLTTFGLSGFFAGSLVAFENNNESEKKGLGVVGTGIIITAALMTGIGIPLWISGSSRMKKHRNILEKMEQKPISLQLNSTTNGIGLALKF